MQLTSLTGTETLSWQSPPFSIIDCNLHPSRGRKPLAGETLTLGNYCNLHPSRGRKLALKVHVMHLFHCNLHPSRGRKQLMLSHKRNIIYCNLHPSRGRKLLVSLDTPPFLCYCNLHPSRGRHTKNEADLCLVFFTFFCFTISPVYAIIKSTERGTPRKARRRRAADCEQEESP